MFSKIFINIYGIFLSVKLIGYAIKIKLNISKAFYISNRFSLEFHLIKYSYLFFFYRGRETGGHARRRPTKFHNNYVEQHYIDSYGSPNSSRYKTVLPDFYLPCHVINTSLFSRKFRCQRQTNSHETSLSISNFFRRFEILHLRIEN